MDGNHSHHVPNSHQHQMMSESHGETNVEMQPEATKHEDMNMPSGEHTKVEHGTHHDEGGSHHSEHTGHDVNQAGHAAHVDHTGHENMFRQRFWISLALSLPVLFYSSALQDWLEFSAPGFPGSTWVTPVFSVVIFIYGGLPFLKMSIPELRNRQPGMMTLISLAISVAFIYSLAALVLPGSHTFFWELVTLIDIMLLGHWLEMRSVRQASGALGELAKLMPDTAERLIPGGSIEEVLVSSLQPGDHLLVRPGTSVPADGEVEEGNSQVNESMVTGESTPVRKEAGAKVIAGTINGNGSLRIRVTATGDETALAGIMRLVKEAQSSKSNTQILADRAAGWLFYIALGVAGVTAIAWVIATGLNVGVIARVATVLVIACPHALGLAVPLVVAITTAMGARNGILVRDRLALENARLVDTVIFDKTGTLTRGDFGVAGIKTIDGWEEDEALELAASLEGDSEHTIAQGIRRSAQERGLKSKEVVAFEALKGRGVSAQVDGVKTYLGGPQLLEMLELELPSGLAEFSQGASAKGRSVVYLIKNNIPVAAFGLADMVRPESKSAVQKLHQLGIQVAMLTGDSQAVAKAVADELDIDQYFAEVLPEDKDKKISQLQKEGKRVAMVGDGVNDAPALTRADVGIAIGGGTDVAIESADIILVNSNPMDVVKIFSLSRQSYRKMVQNLWWAAGYNIVALPLAAGILFPWGILLTPAVGALLMSISTLVVAANAQLLRRSTLS